MRWIAFLVLAACGSSGPPPPGKREVAFDKRVLDDRFFAEGVAVFDVDRDGRLDIVSGDQWFAAPGFEARPIGTPVPLDPATQYSPSFVHYPMDVDGDGWTDLVSFGFPLYAAVWRRNPGDGTAWPAHPLSDGSPQESPRVASLDGAAPVPGDPAARWVPQLLDLPAAVAPLGGHGLGIGDLDGDLRADLITPRGFWSAPPSPGAAWPFTAVDLGPDCAQMQLADVNADGLVDVITSSAHGVGVFWHEQKRTAGAPSFVRHTIYEGFSQSHALEVADVDGDGLVDIVTGKRMWAHGPSGDIDPDAPRVLYWFEQVRDGEPRFVPHLIDDDSGVGTQFVVTDIDGDARPDIAVANKRGTFYFRQR